MSDHRIAKFRMITKLSKITRKPKRALDGLCWPGSRQSQGFYDMASPLAVETTRISGERSQWKNLMAVSIAAETGFMMIIWPHVTRLCIVVRRCPLKAGTFTNGTAREQCFDQATADKRQHSFFETQCRWYQQTWVEWTALFRITTSAGCYGQSTSHSRSANVIGDVEKVKSSFPDSVSPHRTGHN